MKFKLLLFFLFIFGLSSYSQTTDEYIKKLYKNDEYELIISSLSKKTNLTLLELEYMARSHGRLGQFSNGLMYSEELLLRSLAAKDTVNIGIAINVKTENLVDLGRYDEALDFCETNLHYFRPQDSAEYQLLCFKLGLIYFRHSRFEEAYNTYNEITIKRFRDLNLFTGNYSLMLMGMEKFDEAIVYLNKTIESDRELGYDSYTSYSNMALILMLQEKWDEAIFYLDSTAMHAHMYGNAAQRKGIYEYYYSYYSNTGNVTLARRYLDSISITNEEVFNDKLDEELVALKKSFEREHSLEKKIVVVDNELAESEQTLLYGVIIFLVSMLVLAVIITFLWVRNVKSQNQNILIEQKLLRSQMTPHFIFNSLSVLQGMILNKEEDASVSYLNKFSKLLRTTLENSRHKTVSLASELAATDYYMALQNLDDPPRFNYQLTVDPTIDGKAIKIPPMLIQPFIENAIEHAFLGQKENCEIKVNITIKEKQLVCIITENGIGINSSQTKNERDKNSLATAITTERLAMLSKSFKAKGSIKVEDREKFGEKGTLVTLHIPYKLDETA